MRCPECGNEVEENDVFCGYCGAEMIPGAEEKSSEAMPAETGEMSQAPAEKKKPAKKDDPKKDKKKKFVVVVRVLLIILLIVVIVFVVLYIVSAARASEGRKIFDNVPLRRDISIIMSQTGTDFTPGENPEYGALNHIAEYDYICKSEKSVNVSGIELPEWVVLLRQGGDGAMDEAVLYNFYVIKHNWMGSRAAENIDLSRVQFGDKLKAAEKEIGLKPYTIIKESADNTSTYVYRYHYTDADTGNTVVKNIYLVISDVDGQVKDIRDEQLDYLKMILQAEE